MSLVVYLFDFLLHNTGSYQFQKLVYDCCTFCLHHGCARIAQMTLMLFLETFNP